jgi:hypothetical protein
MDDEKNGFEDFRIDNAQIRIDQFSTMAKELVDKFVSECRKENILPSYPRFELWLKENRGELAEISWRLS